MLPYWLMFVLWAGGAVQAERRRERDATFIFFLVASVVTALFIGLRFEVGGDWGAYLKMYERIYFLSLPNAMSVTDPGYAAINWLGAQTGLGILFVNCVCAALFMAGLGRLAWTQPHPSLAILVAVPYLIIVVAMGYTRQGAAIGLICLAIADASERRLVRLIVLIGIAALLHKTALLLLPVVLIPIFRRNVLLGAFGAFMFAVLFIILLRDQSDQMVANYVQSNYDSQGALIRISMNVLAASLFLVLRKRIVMPDFQKSFWTTCAILSILSIVALGVSSASSGVDRLSLYFIPLQSVVYSRLASIFSRDGKTLPSVLIGLIAYAFVVQFVWLNYAENANYWLPYVIGY